jgi:cytochrome c-type biogenesis protein CcmF
MEKREALKIWTVLLAILTFSLSLLGTFLVRSGVLTSVHAFATDPTRGVFILAILVIFIGGSLALFAVRAGTLAPGGIFAPISREGALVLNNLLLTTACATILVGTLYPLVLEALTGERISVGAPYFNLTFAPLMVPLLLAVPFGPMLAWKRGDLYAAAQRLLAAFGLALAAVVVTAAFIGGSQWLPLFGIGLAAFLMLGALSEPAYRIRLGRLPIGESMQRAIGLPRSAWGTTLAHFGLGVAVLGIVSASAWQTETILTMRAGDTVTVAEKSVTMDGFVPRQVSNYRETAVRLTVREGGRVVRVMEPSKRLFPARDMVTTESAIATFGFSQLYISLGDLNEAAATVRVYWKPLVTLIWLGPLVMVLGGLLSLSDRRLRVGAPRLARKLAPHGAG